jgi:hypothetical protein
MARAKKPGTPGKTTIPKDVVKETVHRLKKVFKKENQAEFADLVVIAQQHYLYLETEERPVEILPGLISARFGKGKGVPRTPLGRMVWTGDPKQWCLQLYKWSDEYWDVDNEAWTAGGTPERCLKEALKGWGA